MRKKIKFNTEYKVALSNVFPHSQSLTTNVIIGDPLWKLTKLSVPSELSF
jgi:hypothetical protein